MVAVALVIGLLSAVAWYYAIRAVRTSRSDTFLGPATVVERRRRRRPGSDPTDRGPSAEQHVVTFGWDVATGEGDEQVTVRSRELYERVEEGEQVLLEVAVDTGDAVAVSRADERLVWDAKPAGSAAAMAILGAVLAVVAVLVAGAGS